MQRERGAEFTRIQQLNQVREEAAGNRALQRQQASQNFENGTIVIYGIFPSRTYVNIILNKWIQTL